jgi:hypothetical protein
LYDFAKRPLKVQEYTTLVDYLNKRGFTWNSIVLYLCYHDKELPKAPQPAPQPAHQPAPVVPVSIEESPVPLVEMIDLTINSPETTGNELRT